MCLLGPTCTGVDAWRACAIVTPGTGGQAGAPLLHPIQLQMEEEARFAGQTTIQGGASFTTRRTESTH